MPEATPLDIGQRSAHLRLCAELSRLTPSPGPLAQFEELQAVLGLVRVWVRKAEVSFASNRAAECRTLMERAIALTEALAVPAAGANVKGVAKAVVLALQATRDKPAVPRIHRELVAHLDAIASAGSNASLSDLPDFTVARNTPRASNDWSL